MAQVFSQDRAVPGQADSMTMASKIESWCVVEISAAWITSSASDVRRDRG